MLRVWNKRLLVRRCPVHQRGITATLRGGGVGDQNAAMPFRVTGAGGQSEFCFSTNSRGYDTGDCGVWRNRRPERERDLRDACRAGDLAQFEDLVKPWNGEAEFAGRLYCIALDVAIDETGRNFLHWACDGGNAEIVRQLIHEHMSPLVRQSLVRQHFTLRAATVISSAQG